MMGSNHAATGAAGWLILTTQTTIPTAWLDEATGWSMPDLVLGFGWGGFSGLGIVLGMFLVAGAAMAPDSDHHSATIASSLPPVSQWVCSGIGMVSGGHRHGTHSIVGVAVFTAIAYVAGLWRMDVGPLANVGIGAGIVAVLLIAFAAKALKTIPDTMRKTPWLVGLIGGALIAVLGPDQTWWLPVAVGLGCTIHLLGDILTTEGINLVWPVAIKAPKILHGVPVLNKIWKPNGFLALPVLGSAGSVREYLVLVPVSIYVIAVTVLTLAAAG
jgi:membrane-bound metal-dependent hydrolase YbcI (DUF457 family)